MSEIGSQMPHITLEQNPKPEQEVRSEKFLGTLKSGEKVIDRLKSHIHAGVEPLLTETLSRIESRGQDFFRAEIDLGRIVGHRTCVETSKNDEIIYAQRIGRPGWTRFVKGRETRPCSSLVIALMKKKNTTEPTYILLTAYIGITSETEPWDPKASEASWNFWMKHALVWGTEPIREGTEVKECPWIKYVE